MRLAQAGQQFADLQQVLGQPEMAVGTQALQVDQAVAGALDPFAQEFVRALDIGGMVQNRRMRLGHFPAATSSASCQP